MSERKVFGGILIKKIVDKEKRERENVQLKQNLRVVTYEKLRK